MLNLALVTLASKHACLRFFFSCILAVFCVSLSLDAEAGSKQVIAVPSGTRVILSGSREARVDAYCLECKIPNAGTLEDKVKTAIGKVKIEYTNDTPSQVMELTKALALGVVEITGDNGAWSGNTLVVRSSNPELKQLTFEDTVVATFDADSANLNSEALEKFRDFFEQVLKDVGTPDRNSIPGLDTYRHYLQLALWRRQLPFEEARDEDASVQVLRSLRANEEASKLRFFRLSTQSDCSLLSNIAGQHLIHDVGATEVEISRLVDSFDTRSSAGKKRVSVVITHAHRDHYKGLRYLIEREDVTVDFILIGLPRENTARILKEKQPQSQFAKLIHLLKEKYSLNTNSNHTNDVTLFRRNDAALSTKGAMESIDTSREGLVACQIQLGDVTAMLQWLDPSNVKSVGQDMHRHNIMVTYTHRGTKVLDFGDADERHVTAYLKSHLWALRQKAYSGLFEKTIQARSVQDIEAMANLPQFNELAHAEFQPTVLTEDAYLKQIRHAFIYVDVVKWPHHAWFPRSKTGRDLMKLLLKMSRPRDLLISVKGVKGGGAVSKRLKKIASLVEEVCEEEAASGSYLEIEIRTTEEEDVEYQTLMPSKSCFDSLAGFAADAEGYQRRLTS